MRRRRPRCCSIYLYVRNRLPALRHSPSTAIRSLHEYLHVFECLRRRWSRWYVAPPMCIRNRLQPLRHSLNYTAIRSTTTSGWATTMASGRCAVLHRPHHPQQRPRQPQRRRRPSAIRRQRSGRSGRNNSCHTVDRPVGGDWSYRDRLRIRPCARGNWCSCATRGRAATPVAAAAVAAAAVAAAAVAAASSLAAPASAAPVPVHVVRDGRRGGRLLRDARRRWVPHLRGSQEPHLLPQAESLGACHPGGCANDGCENHYERCVNHGVRVKKRHAAAQDRHGVQVKIRRGVPT